MPKTIPFAKGLALPESVLTQKLAALGISGSGKTFAAGKLVEGMLDAGGQVVIVDTIGNWWGLRLGASGKPKGGIEIPILGGDHGDVALEPEHGELVAQQLVESGSSMIIDISDFTQGEIRKFVVAFATKLLALKKTSHSALMVVWEECQDIVPQRVFGEDARMVGAVQRLVKRGRNYGVGTILISQRPAAVNKDVLTQIETLFAFRTTSPHDRKALDEWFDGHIANHPKDKRPELAALETGACWVLSPAWLSMLKQVKVERKRTFDASATPDVGAVGPRGTTLAPINLDAFKKRMGAAIERAKDNDPAVLRQRVSELERQLKTKGPTAIDRIVTKEVEKKILLKADIAAIEKAIARGEKLSKTLADEVYKIRTGAQQIVTELSKATAAVTIPRVAEPKHRRQEAPQVPFSRVPPITERGEYKGIGKGERQILAAVAQHNDGVTRIQLTTITGYAVSSRNTYLQRLRQAGLINDGDRITVTDKGLAELGPNFERLPVGRALQEHWLRELGGGEREILKLVCDVYPNAIGRSEISERLNYATSSRNTYLQRLSARELVVTERGGDVKAAEELF